MNVLLKYWPMIIAAAGAIWWASAITQRVADLETSHVYHWGVSAKESK